MCGIVGFVDTGSPESGERLIEGLTRLLAHRGPDGQGVWYDRGSGVALGHRRLSIIDLSELGRQPMASRDGRFQLTFNGEIYNFLELRRELEQAGETFRSESDTEVMLAAISRWGVKEALTRFNGMYAFALWDGKEHRLHLARDRMGEKPLYYGRMRSATGEGSCFVFASELKALRAYPSFEGEIDRDALALFLRYNYVPAPFSIYRGVAKLPAATLLTIPLTPRDGLGEPVLEPYWRAEEAARQGIENPLDLSDGEAIDELDRRLHHSVRQRMVSDVPLGAFLSGGIDSSTVVALMQKENPRPVRTFSIGFDIEGFNEAVHARAVAEHLGTDHTELYVRAEQALDVIPKLPTIYDEPFADSSQIPTYLVSELARRSVTVSLSGDGGDELFWGYTRYQVAREMWRRIGWMPAPLRRLLGGGLQRVPLGLLNGAFGWASPILERYGRPGPVGDKLRKAARVASMKDADELYRFMVGHWRNSLDVVQGSRSQVTNLTNPRVGAAVDDRLLRMQLLDQVSYLPDDILAKVDRASMAHGLEVRVPFLDHELVELSWRMPFHLKRREGQGKWILRQVLDRYVPRSLVERPKMGFGVPLAAWLRGPLREWAEDLLAESRLQGEGLLDPEPIRNLWREHLSGDRNWHYHLWDVLVFEAWLEEEKAHAPLTPARLEAVV